MSQWFEVKLLVSDELREPVINRLFELGAEGVDETSRAGEIAGYFPESTRTAVTSELPAYLDSLSKMFPTAPKVTMALTTVPDGNWAESYKAHYLAQKLSNSFFLKPAWDTTTEVPPGMIPIIMEPGQAFGTGLHASTRLTLTLLERVVHAVPSRKQLRLLDVGTGTGILAIAASKLGIPRVLGTDIDPIAVETAKENCVLNSCNAIEISDASLATFKDAEFDVVLANILLETHRSLVEEYRRVLAPGGTLVLSGLLGSQSQEIDDIVLRSGFVAEVHESHQEWLAISYIRRNG